MSDLLEYKCPCCGGVIEFDVQTQTPKCPYCDTEFELETLKGYEEDLREAPEKNDEWEDANGEWQEGEQDNLRVYVCNSCGGEVVCDDTTAATHCPYCSNPVIMKGQFAGDLRPDLVIPFKLDKAAAKAGYLKHISKKRLLPKVFKDENHIDEIKGVYVPFWVYDAKADADIRYRATRVRHYSTATHNCTETSYYSVLRSGTLDFVRVPVDGSTKMDDDLMESIEPYDFSEAVDFKTAYLSGFLADRYDVGMEDSRARACERIKASTEDVLRSTVNGYATVHKEAGTVSIGNGKTKYVLFPVWLLNTTWKDKKFTFAMNGQTGKFVGNLPVDKGLYVKYLLGGAAIFSVITFILLNVIMAL